VGKVLSSVEYDQSVIDGLEKAIADINQEAVDKSHGTQALERSPDAAEPDLPGGWKCGDYSLSKENPRPL
jgi:hypothetical protein